MTKITQITYGIKVRVAREDYAYDSEGEDESEIAQEQQFAKEHDDFWEKRIAKENQQTFTYTFNDRYIRYERNQHQAHEEFIRILPESGVMQHFSVDERTQEAKLNKHYLYGNAETSDWKIAFEIQQFESERKTILGYDCFKMDVKQTRINEKEGWEIVDQYELYVTDQINLPASLVIHLWQPVVAFCALEIKSIRVKNPNSYSIQSVIEIKTDVDEEVITLPQRYQELLKGE